MKAEQIIKATKEHCKLCFDTLLSTLTGKPKPAWPTTLPDAETPLFVTWKKNGNLRGCIGTFSPDRHSKLVPQYAITAAMKDPRFPPVRQEEVKLLTCHVSLLVQFEQGKDIYDWQVGKHGIIIKYSYKGGHYSGTFLPEVAKEQNWNKQETLEYLIKKAGFYGSLEQIAPSIKLTRYQSSKQSLSYDQYCKLL